VWLAIMVSDLRNSPQEVVLTIPEFELQVARGVLGGAGGKPEDFDEEVTSVSNEKKRVR